MSDNQAIGIIVFLSFVFGVVLTKAVPMQVHSPAQEAVQVRERPIIEIWTDPHTHCDMMVSHGGMIMPRMKPNGEYFCSVLDIL